MYKELNNSRYDGDIGVLRSHLKICCRFWKLKMICYAALLLKSYKTQNMFIRISHIIKSIDDSVKNLKF